MRTHRYSTMVVLLIAFWVNGTLAWGVSKEMVQLQTQVQGLQDQMTQMQTSFNERMGVMQHLMDQNTDSMNKVAASITAVQTSLEKLQTDNGGKVEQLSGQIQALNDSIDELKARLTKVSKQLEDMQAAQQSAAEGQAAQQAKQQALAQAPPRRRDGANGRETRDLPVPGALLRRDGGEDRPEQPVCLVQPVPGL